MRILLKRFFFGVAIGTLLLVAINLSLPPYHQSMLAEIAIWALFAISFDILFGYIGLLSFGQCLFFGIGAYGTALSIIYWNLPLIEALLFGVICAGLLAVSVGPLIMKLENHYFVIMTVLLALIFLYLANNMSWITGGDDGLPVPIPQKIFFAIPVFKSPFVFTQYFVFLMSVIVFTLSLLFVKSPTGLVLQGIRDNPRRAEFLGYSVRKYRFLVWIIAGVIAGFAGSLYVLRFRYVSTSYLHWTMSGEGIVWTILGGKGTLLGPAIGTASLLYLKDTLSSWFAAYPLIVGVLLIILIHTAPNGLLGMIKSEFLQNKIYRVVKPVALETMTKIVDKTTISENTPDTSPVLEIENLSKRFDGVLAVYKVSMKLGLQDALVLFFPTESEEIQQHHIILEDKSETKPDFSIVGPNAAGKSTFFNLLTGLIIPDEGRIIFKGKTIFQGFKGKQKLVNIRPHKIAQMGISRTFQHLSIFKRLTVYENLWLAAQSNNRRQALLKPAESDSKIRYQVTKTLRLIGLEHEAGQLAGTLSFGRQKMLELGLAISTIPDLILLDEPTAGVSPNETNLILDLICSLSREMGILIIEHDIEIVKKLNFRTCVFGNGRIICEGTPTEILDNKYVQEHFLGAIKA